MQNVMEITGLALRGDAVERLSSQIHESSSATRRGLESALPVSLAGLAQHFSTEKRAEELLGTIRGGDYPHVDADEVSKLVADPESTSRLAQSGQGFLSRIFGKKLFGIVDALARQTGLSRGSASTVLGLAAPLVLDAVGKEAESRHLDARGLSRFLGEEGRMASGALPGALSGAVGAVPSTSSVEDVKERVGGAALDARDRLEEAVEDIRERGGRYAARAREGARHAVEKPSRVLPWLLAGLGLLGLIALIMAGVRRSRPAMPDIAVRAPEVPAVPVPQPPEIAPPAAPEVTAPEPVEVTTPEPLVVTPRPPVVAAPTLPEVAAPSVPSGPITLSDDATAFSRFLAGKGALPQRFILVATFDSTSAAVAGNALFSGVAQALKENPNAKVRLEGYADSAGSADDDRTLALMHANATKSRLVALGAPAESIETVGFSSDEPVGSSDTDEGGEQNRRIELVVLER